MIIPPLCSVPGYDAIVTSSSPCPSEPFATAFVSGYLQQNARMHCTYSQSRRGHQFTFLVCGRPLATKMG
eukprot:2409399-Prymnesium_polylepis.2